MKIYRLEAEQIKGKRSARRHRVLAEWGMKNKIAPMVYTSKAYAEDVATRAAADLAFGVTVYDQDVAAKTIAEAVELLKAKARPRRA